MTRLQEIRKAARMTQVQLSQKAGVSQPYLHDLEKGNRNAKPETWERIASALNCTVEELTADTATEQPA